MSRLFGEPRRDPELGAALRRIESASPTGDAEVLRRRILTAARPRLVGLGTRAPHWWEWISGWMRIALPVGLAASFVAGLLLPRSGEMALLSSYTTETGADSTLIVAAFSEPSARGQLAAHLIAPEGSDWLLEQALTR
jgi:hypothetical protein